MQLGAFLEILKSLIQRKLFIGIVLFALTSLLGVKLYVSSVFATALTFEKNATFEIQEGTFASQVIREVGQLATTDLSFRSKVIFKLLPELSQFKAGIYDLPTNTTMEQLLGVFVRGEVKQVSITLVEGLRWTDWQNQLKAHPWLQNKQELDQVKKLLVTNRESIEGLLMPDTYQVPAGSDAFYVVELAYRAMQKYLSDNWEQRQTGLPIATPYESLILASIVEKETGVAEERPRIAGVFVNRLNDGMRLQTDPTVIYGLGDRFDGNITRAHLREATAYNTYVIKGLPPTPIAMAGREAIDAVLHPLATNDFYFVSKGDGSHYFSETLKEHNQAVQKYQIKKKSKP